MVGFYTWTRSNRVTLSKLKVLNFVYQKAEEEVISKWTGLSLIPAAPQRFWFVINSPFEYYGSCINPEDMGLKECHVFNQYRLLLQLKPFKIKTERVVTPS